MIKWDECLLKLIDYLGIMGLIGRFFQKAPKIKIANGQKVVITGAYAINSEYKFRKGSDPMEGMKM